MTENFLQRNKAFLENRELFLKKKREEVKKKEEKEFLEIEKLKKSGVQKTMGKSAEKVEERLLRYQKGYDDHRKQLQESLAKQRAKELKFRPEIQTRSAKNLENEI